MIFTSSAFLKLYPFYGENIVLPKHFGFKYSLLKLTSSDTDRIKHYGFMQKSR